MRHFFLPVALSINSLIFAADFSSIARSDIMPDGHSSVDYCFSIANLDRYPNYSFFSEVKSGRSGEVLAVDKIDGKGCYQASGYRAYATVFAQKKQGKSSKPTNKGRIYAKSQVDSIRDFRTIYQVDKVKDVLKIKSVSTTEVKLEYVRAVYTFSNGKQESKPYLTQKEKPLPSSPNSSLNLWYLAHSVLAVGIIAILYRQFKLDRQNN